MRLSRIKVENFRLLRASEIDLNDENIITILVGANNSGKTSAIDALRLFTEGSARKFELSDFSLSTRSEFGAAEAAYLNSQDEDGAAQPTLPSISMTLEFDYDDVASDLAVASDLFMDLDPTVFHVATEIEFAVKEEAKLAADFVTDRREGETLCAFLESRLATYFGLTYYKIDPATGERQALPDASVLPKLIRVDFIPAQRHMADQDSGQSTRLSSMLHGHYESRYRVDEPAEYKELEDALSAQSGELSKKYMKAFGGLVASLEQFGVKERTPKLSIKAQLKADTLFKDNTKVFYSAEIEAATAEKPAINVDLPEKYNGLGFKNLIFMVLQLKSFRDELDRAEKVRPRVHLILLEEPEVHLHPQVQTVFVKEIEKFLITAGGSDVQIVLTTHSSHMVAHSGFSPIRYFRRKAGSVEIRDLLKFRKAATTAEQKEAVDFLRSYLTQTRCDLFFADKAVLIEGQVERLLLPLMIENCSVGQFAGLATDYLSIMEVGGAYAHIFKGLIEFLGVPTLVVTDIDAVDANGEKCRVVQGVKTSNPVLKSWKPGTDDLAALMVATSAQRTDNNTHIAYQVAEVDGRPCGRSFEEAFIYANAKWLVDNYAKLRASGSKFKGKDVTAIGADAFGINVHKVDFALDLIASSGWVTPRYIADGLRWLALRPAL